MRAVGPPDCGEHRQAAQLVRRRAVDTPLIEGWSFRALRILVASMTIIKIIRPSEEHPLPWRYAPVAFDGGGVGRFIYAIIAANDVEVCTVSDQVTARFICSIKLGKLAAAEQPAEVVNQ
jgi:hypothetical protein